MECPEDPQLGFSPESKASAAAKQIASRALDTIKKNIQFHTSTPTGERSIMELSFSKCYEQASIDYDSGYVSNNLVESTVDGNVEVVVEDPAFITEDALLEEPASLKTTEDTKAVYEEFSSMYYHNSIIDCSVSTDATSFSGLQESDKSCISISSPIITPLKNIVASKSNLNIFPASTKDNSLNNVLSLMQNLVGNRCNVINKNLNNHTTNFNQDDDSNSENNINAINCKSSKPIQRKKATPKKKRKRSLSRTPQKVFTNPVNPNQSPDLFSDDEIAPTPEPLNTSLPPEKYINDNDVRLIKRLNDSLGGVLPPPSLTMVELTVNEMLQRLENNTSYFWHNPPTAKQDEAKPSLLINTTVDVNFTKSEFPKVMENRYHGLHYNRSKLSEEMESLCTKYAQRFVGGETQSSCTVFDTRLGSPSKRRSSKLRWTAKSPGRRLSHLARRRITFSSSNLLGPSGSNRQVVMDARRYELLTRRPSPRKNMKSPRKTPRKSPRRAAKTPTSSAKKRKAFKVMALSQEPVPGPSTSKASATKRALFQSPEKKGKASKLVPSTSNSSLSPWKMKGPPKRALFSSPSKSSPTAKRKRLDSTGDTLPPKIQRCLSMQEEGTSSTSAAKLKPTRSESNLTTTVDLSAHHKKKLQWAVYEALRGQNITVTHPQFRQFASTLARVTRRLIPSLMSTPKSEMGTSERMLRIAKQHVFAATRGKTVDEIVQAYEASRVKIAKPSGYVGLDDVKMDVSVARSKDNVFQDKANTIMNSTSKDNVNMKQPESKIERAKKIINFGESFR